MKNDQTMKKKLLLFPVFLLLFGIACDDEEVAPDTEAPAIEVSDPVADETFPAGSNIPFNAVFTDDRALGTYSIDIHNNFDEHAHGRKMDDPALVRFTYKKNFSLPAEKVHVADLQSEILIPETAVAGPYHFIVQAIDAEGNATSYQDNSTVEIEILVTNTSMAVINITNLEGGELEIEAGQPFVVEGTITDPEHPTLSGFEEIMITLGESDEEHHDHDHGRKMEGELFEIEIHHEDIGDYENPDGSLNISGMVNYALDQSAADELLSEEVDHLVLKVKVIDRQGNYSIEKIPVHLHTD